MGRIDAERDNVIVLAWDRHTVGVVNGNFVGFVQLALPYARSSEVHGRFYRYCGLLPPQIDYKSLQLLDLS